MTRVGPADGGEPGLWIARTSFECEILKYAGISDATGKSHRIEIRTMWRMPHSRRC